MIYKHWKGGTGQAANMIICLLMVIFSSAAVLVAEEPPVPDDCKASNYDSDGGLELDCSLSAINSAEEKTNFSVLPSQHTKSLTVRCREPTLSQLEENGLAHLAHLEKLTLDNCHFRSIPPRAFWGLSHLKYLKIQTRNAGVLAIEVRALEGLENLESLDLNGNYIRHVAPGVLCSLPKLTQLNLSKNEIGSLSDLGLQKCPNLAHLKSLDMSHNGISGITVRQMSQWPQLEDINLANNYVRSIEKASFLESHNLKKIDLSNNQLSSLHRVTFELKNLKSLILANNTINTFPDTIFHESLTYLDLSGNFLTAISPRLLSNLASLKSLDLRNNELESIHGQAFANLKSLTYLRMDGNRLSKLARNLLRGTKLIQTLILSDNALTRIVGQQFSNLNTLTHLLLDRNLLEDLPPNLFANNSKLSVLDLSHNRFATIPEAAKIASQMQSFSLSGNLVGDLGSLQMPSLWRLEVSDNKLTNLTAENFRGLSSLQVLDLSRNKIYTVEKGAFRGQIKALRLDSNNLERMDNLFQELKELSWLNVSANSISVFDYAMLPRGSITWLDLHQNAIASLGNYFSLEAEFPRLTHIDASFNRITELGPQNLPNNVETLQLNDNQIQTLVPYTFFKKNYLKSVDLTVNKIESIDRNALRLASELGTQNVPNFLLGGNPIKCDCHMAWFKEINQLQDLNFPKVMDLESIYCQLLYSRDKTFVPLVEAQTDEFLCTYKTHCFALCHCCEYDACDCEMTCPDNCTCYHDNSWSKNIAECSGADFADLPDQLPMDATEIFLDGNNVGELFSHTFIGRKNLKSLYLNNSLISSVQNHTFNGLAALEILHLEGNSIKELQGDEFHGLKALKELYLQNNLIRSVNNVTFRDLQSLQILYLHGNRLVDFPVWTLSFNTQLAQMRLADNTWSCGCEFVNSFVDWLQKHGDLVLDSRGVACDPHVQASALVTTSRDDDFSSGPKNLILDRQNSSCQETSISTSTHVQEKIVRDYLPLFGIILAILLLLATVLILMVVYRNDLRVWLHSRYGVRFFQRIDDSVSEDKIFDAFLTYSAKDDAYVRQVLAPELELSSQQYKLCLFYRDLPLQAYLADTIVQASEASRRTILILSENFLKSEWSRYDYKSGMHQTLRNARTKLIVIILGNINSRDIDPDLRLYLKSSIVVYWGDKHFWDKLKYALPDVDKSKTTGLFCHGYNSMQLIQSSESDTNSFRYETCPRRPYATHHPHNGTLNGNTQSSEQDSTRTMTIHI